MEASKPDFELWASETIVIRNAMDRESDNEDYYAAGCHRVWDDYVDPLQSELSRLREENEELRKHEKPLVYEFASWLSEQNFTNPDISKHEWVDRFFKERKIVN